MKNQWLLVGLVLGAMAASAWGTPILEYKFNGTGTTSASTGSDTTSVTFYNSAGSVVDLHGAAGSGVAGDLVGHALFGVDRAFNNTASTGMGSAGLGGKARHAADNNNIDALASYTVSGWFKTQSVALQGFARIVDNYVGPDGFVVPGGNVAGELRSSVDGWDGDQADMAGYGDINKWVFFAVTYAGATGEMKFYKGYRNNAEAGGSAMVALLGTLTPTQGSVNQEPYIFTIGNHNTTTTYNRPFDGFLDNIRVHGAASGAAGALSLNDLEALRAGDVLIPEPTSLALAWVGALGVMRIGRRRRR